MTSEISEDVVLQIASPQIIPPEGGVATAAGRGGAFSGSVELGRRLLLAARLGQTQLVLELMAKGAPFTTDWLGTSPLHLAASNAHTETCAVLLRAGVSRDSRTKVERTPLHLAAHAGHAAVASLLLEHGAQVDCRDMLRMTPLHWAAERGHAAAAGALLRHGADPHAVSKFNKTPHSLALARNRTDILKMIEDSLKEREAAKSVDALRIANEQITEIPPAEQQRALESIERLQETVKSTTRPQSVHTEPIKIEIGRPPAGQGSQEAGDALAAQLLRKHGITLLPHDDGSTVLSAIQSGRTVVLSDAGKLMLKESSSPPAPAPAPTPAPAPLAVSKGVILTAAPVKSPPKPGVKIFTLNNKMLAMPKENKVPIKKVVNAQDMQIKFVTLPADTKIISPGKVSMKAKHRLRPAGALQASAGAGAGQRPAVKIIMHKANFNKMMAEKGHVMQNGMETSPTMAGEPIKVSQGSTACGAGSVYIGSGAGGGAGSVYIGSGAGGGAVCVPPEFLSSNSTHYLRAQLLAAHRALHDLRREAAALRERLAAPPAPS